MACVTRRTISGPSAQIIRTATAANAGRASTGIHSCVSVRNTLTLASHTIHRIATQSHPALRHAGAWLLLEYIHVCRYVLPLARPTVYQYAILYTPLHVTPENRYIESSRPQTCRQGFCWYTYSCVSVRTCRSLGIDYMRSNGPYSQNCLNCQWRLSKTFVVKISLDWPKSYIYLFI